MYRVGLLGTGARLAARVLLPGLTDRWITDVRVDGLPMALRFFSGSGAWGAPEYLSIDGSLPFPYGLPVTPAG